MVLCNDSGCEHCYPLRDNLTEKYPALNRETEGSNPSLAANYDSSRLWLMLQTQFDLWKLIRWEPPTGLTFEQVSHLLTLEQVGFYQTQFVDEPSLVAGDGQQLFDHRTLKAFLLWWDKSHPIADDTQ